MAKNPGLAVTDPLMPVFLIGATYQVKSQAQGNLDMMRRAITAVYPPVRPL